VASFCPRLAFDRRVVLKSMTMKSKPIRETKHESQFPFPARWRVISRYFVLRCTGLFDSSFPFRDPSIIQLIISPSPPLDSLESVDYGAFPCNRLSPQRFTVSSFIAVIYTDKFARTPQPCGTTGEERHVSTGSVKSLDLTTGQWQLFSKSFPRPHTGCNHRRHDNSPPRSHQ